MKWFLGLLFFPLMVWASANQYYFPNKVDEERFFTLTAELRCLVCQNQNLSESNAPLAVDLRQQIFEKISARQSDDEIIRYLVDRYGNFILYRPPLTVTTAALWLGPFILLLCGLTGLFLYIKKQTRV